MEDSNFQAKYRKHKMRVKIWESEFMEKFGRKPNKNDIKIANITIRDAYKMYWQLKTRALEETLTEISICNVRVENVLSPQVISNSLKQLENQQDMNKLELNISKCLELQNKCSSHYLTNITEFSSNLEKKTAMNELWKQHFNVNNTGTNNDQIAPSEKVTPIKLSQQMCKSLTLSKRNPKKSISVSKSYKHQVSLDTFCNKTTKLQMKNDKFSDIVRTTFNKDINIIFDEKKTNNQPFQQLIETFPKYNKQLNSAWLERCVSNDSLRNSIITTYKSKSLNFHHLTNDNFATRISLLNDQSSTDDEDYIYVSDSEEERKNKRTLNSNKVFCDFNFNPAKRLCMNNDIFYKEESDNKFLQNSMINISQISLSADSNELKSTNNCLDKEIKCKKLNSKNFPNKYLSKTIFLKNEYQNIDQNKGINNDNMKDKINKISIKDLTPLNDERQKAEDMNISNCTSNFSNTLEPYSTKINTFSLKFMPKSSKRLEQSIHTRKLNENFIKINLKKNVFVRGKKIFNLSKYKKNQWKQKRKEHNFDKSNLNLDNCNYEKKKPTYFKYKESGDFFSDSDNSDNFSSSFDVNADISSYSTEEIDEFVKFNAVKDCYLNTNIQSKNISTLKQKMLTNSSECKDFQNKNVLDNLNFATCEENIGQKFDIQPLYNLLSDQSCKDTPLEVWAALKKFGHKEFHAGQEKAIMRILSGQSTLVTLATGTGKSLCYQLPAYMYSKKSTCITLVISPLVSLMDDQASRIPDFLQAASLHTNQSPKYRAKVLKKLKEGQLNILLISPEMIINGQKLNGFENLRNILPPIAFACIDEVHCISQWSHNFRPSYLRICKVLREKFGIKVILGLTATASSSVVMNIINFLNITDGINGVISSQSVPSNLNLTISRDKLKDEALIKLLQSEKYETCDSIIVYCTRREECVRVAKLLQISFSPNNQIYSKTRVSSNVEAYHAGLSAKRRKLVQTAFMKSEIRIIVATIAFGMGLNKSNIRSVIHFNMPASIEGYVQEIGRAGRDGHPAYCHLFLSQQENSDEYELRRHINANTIDRYTIRRLFQKIFIPCNCVGYDKALRCTGHEIIFSIGETVSTLDISEEIITTLLCYLEFHPKHFIKLLSPTYMYSKIYSFRGPNALKSAAQSSKALENALIFLKENGTYDENCSAIEFPIISVASAMGLNSTLVKKQLKQLEWITENNKLKKSGISVQFHTLGFRVIVFGNLSNEDKEEILESINNQTQLHTAICLQRLDFISTTMRKFSFFTVKDCFNLTQEVICKSKELKSTIKNYFEFNNIPINISAPLETILKDEEVIVEDIRNLILSYRDINFTGRSVARIFHGIQSPNFPTIFWSRCRFWRAHISEDFNAICQLAAKEILKMKDI